MTILFSKFVSGPLRQPASVFAGQVCSLRAWFDIAAAQQVLNDIIDMAVLPANHRLIDAILDSTDLDTDGTPAITLDVGIMSGNPGEGGARTCGAELFSGATVAQAGGMVRMSLRTGLIIAPSAVDRSVGVKIATAPDAAAAGQIGLTLLHAP